MNIGGGKEKDKEKNPESEQNLNFLKTQTKRYHNLVVSEP